uniref:Uncharacterized protein n=1 Tax=Arundo donax TaxID=35708 RepID=A0A0A9GB60_ARUDO
MSLVVRVFFSSLLLFPYLSVTWYTTAVSKLMLLVRWPKLLLILVTDKIFVVFLAILRSR